MTPWFTSEIAPKIVSERIAEAADARRGAKRRTQTLGGEAGAFQLPSWSLTQGFAALRRWAAGWQFGPDGRERARATGART